MWERAEALSVSPKDQRELTRLVRNPRTPQKLALRASIVLGAADGMSNNQLAQELATSRPTVIQWRRRYQQGGVEGLSQDAPRPGRKKQITAEQIAAIIDATLHTTPRNATQWSARTLGRAQGVSHSTVFRIWQSYGLQPHSIESFKLSTDPHFAAKVRDIVGLYLNPPDRALVYSVDEQIQALDRTQPLLPLRLGIPARQTHDYTRHGTTTLFAALDVLTGKVIGSCQPRHRHMEFLSFLEALDRAASRRRQIHLILDNYATHKHPAVQAWFRAHPRYHLHYTPTSSSWINLVERWFAEITRKRIRRGTFSSVGELVRAIHAYIRENNKAPLPFVWTASASSILRKVRHCKGVRYRN